MSHNKSNLCKSILKDNFGEVAEAVGCHLLKDNICALRYLALKSKFSLEQTKKVLCVLLQHNICDYTTDSKGTLEYLIDSEIILRRIRFPNYIYCAKTLYGDAAELVAEEILQNGQMLMTQVVKNVTNKLNEALTNAGHPEIASSFVQEKFNCLVNTHFLQRCKNRTNTSNVEDVADDLYKIPVTGSRKRKHSTDNNPVSLKKRRILDSPEKEEPDDAGIYWKANFDRFHQYMRDQLMITAIASKIDKKAGEVLRTLLRVCELKSDPYSTVTNAVTLTEIFNALPKDFGLTRKLLQIYLSMISEDSTCFVSKVDESGGGMYVVNIYKALTQIATSHLESVVLERFGSKCLRIFRVLLLKKHVEQKQIEDFAMISAKEAKELLYNMFSQKFITTSEIAKTPDHAPSRTFYLFKVDIHKLAQHVLERSYKAMYNATLRKDNELTEHRRLLDKQERVDAIVASIEQAGGDDTQKDEIEQTITPTERDQIDTVKRTVQMLETSEIQIDDTMFVLEMYLFYANQDRLLKCTQKKKK
ncbi:DNA-directed RNA polymerase III subunit RPC3-like [Mytilus trossulus]|uniref:DNA-directed RNA polymerase III subunit RPC3-like n=1 Tax=Mytilus trossulus TaxID=6551 RepID=UPI0030045245